MTKFEERKVNLTTLRYMFNIGDVAGKEKHEIKEMVVKKVGTVLPEVIDYVMENNRVYKMQTILIEHGFDIGYGAPEDRIRRMFRNELKEILISVMTEESYASSEGFGKGIYTSRIDPADFYKLTLLSRLNWNKNQNNLDVENGNICSRTFVHISAWGVDVVLRKKGIIGIEDLEVDDMMYKYDIKYYNVEQSADGIHSLLYPRLNTVPMLELEAMGDVENALEVANYIMTPWAICMYKMMIAKDKKVIDVSGPDRIVYDQDYFEHKYDDGKTKVDVRHDTKAYIEMIESEEFIEKYLGE